MASLPIEEPKNHEIDWYFSVRDRIDKLGRRNTLKDGIPIKMKTPLSNTLTRLSNSPAVSFTATHCNGRYYSEPMADISLTVGGEDAGTFGNPNIEKILEKSKPSPFGKGDKTIMDLEYRNGREIEAKDIIIGSQAAKRALYNLIETHISESLFVDKAVEIDLYKLAVYGKDGHFDWHRDTTHDDDHHATVLVGLNTEWKGGNLGLKHEGRTVDVDMHAVMREETYAEDDDESSDDEQDGDETKKPEDKRSVLGFQIVAFYTDIEHKVESITDGTRIVLQFDVNVPGGQSPNEDEKLDLSDIPDGSGKPVLDTLKPLFRFSDADANRDAILEELVSMIQNLHTSQSINEVVFPLRHLYRLASIKPECLKGVDGYLYEGLKKKFEVALKPIVLIHQNYDGDWDLKEALAYPFVSVHDENEGDKKPPKRRKIEWKSEIHVPARYELAMISSTDYNEYTGNEAQTGEGKYFGAGMFVTAKAA